MSISFSLGPKLYNVCLAHFKGRVCVHAHVCWEIVLWENIYLHISYFPEIIALIYSAFNPRGKPRILGLVPKEGMCY